MFIKTICMLLNVRFIKKLLFLYSTLISKITKMIAGISLVMTVVTVMILPLWLGGLCLASPCYASSYPDSNLILDFVKT